MEALTLVKNRPRRGAAYRVYLASGFTPLHLQTFLAAYLTELCPKELVEVVLGLFGDLAGNLERLDPSAVNAVAVPIEWADLDARLGLRSLGGWKPSDLGGILETATHQLARIGARLRTISISLSVVISLPTLPLPPIAYHRTDQDCGFEMELRKMLDTFAMSCLGMTNLQIVSWQVLALHSPMAERFDVRSEINSGFPYQTQHASTLAGLFAGLLRGSSPKKGLITDLDDTLWAGILGEAGVDGVHWDMDRHSHIHGLYQQMLDSLAAAGVLLAIATKNDPLLVSQAFERKDLLLKREQVFPIEANWHQKSKSVGRILEAWNIGPEAVVFIDDSPMELAEVQSAFPEMQCRLFPREDPGQLWRLLLELRQAFGKSSVSNEDSIRLTSLRGRSALLESEGANGGGPEAFLESAGARIQFEISRGVSDTRAVDLLNKTNQFNLNGERFTVSGWSNILSGDRVFLLTVTYQDKFGPLGKIAAVLGEVVGSTVHVRSWVMSCRAFSRHIEYQTLRYLFQKFAADRISFSFQPTPRNGPMQDFLRSLHAQLLSDFPVFLSRDEFFSTAPHLFHVVEEAPVSGSSAGS
jgi:FkbH-like protein